MSKLVEEWRPVVGYEGLYEVSDWLNVRSIDRIITYKNGKMCKHNGKILSTFSNGEYRGVHLYKNNINENKLVHHIAAEAFIPNPENKPFIDHIIPLSNGGEDVLSNLRWCTQKENMNNELTTINLSKAFTGKKHTDEWKENISKILRNCPITSKRVFQYTKNMEFVREWESISEAERNGFSSSAICQCCKGKRKTHKGHIWSYVPL